MMRIHMHTDVVGFTAERSIAEKIRDDGIGGCGEVEGDDGGGIYGKNATTGTCNQDRFDSGPSR